MTNRDAARAKFAEMLANVPETMLATRTVLSATLAGIDDKSLEPGLEKSFRELTRQLTALNVSVLILEDRLERLEGRPGLPGDGSELLDALNSLIGT